MSTASRSIGFIGLGQMGFGMAQNLLKAGHEVLAYDVAVEPLARFAALGGRAARHPAEIGAECESAMVMVVSGPQVDAVLSGRDGLLDTMTSGTVVICSTISLSELLPIAERARGRGVTVLDCPVSGGVSGADAGTLTLLCGGDATAIEAQRPFLDAVSANVFHLGPLGAGLVGKLANNLIIGVGRLAVGEAFAMARQAGVPLDRLYHTLRTCTADSWMLRSLEGAILRGEYPPATFLGLKDLTAAVESGRSVHQAMPVTALTRELYQLIDAKLGGLHGSNEVLRYYLEP
ncbi:MAG TPA: NAD(P)-dependent oxidoreductase [Candidatus Binatia bacterium]|nr:NAD(P)-dependent oxidoreductase [Candidatus Binatia bacterium]